MGFKEEKVEQLLKQFEPLLFKTLGRVNVRQTSSNYDDVLQELRLKLIKLAERFDGDPFTHDVVRFLGFAKQGLFRYSLDLLHKESQQPETTGSDVTELEHLLHGDLIFGDNTDIKHFFQQASRLLTQQEQALFVLLAQGGYTTQELADELGVSRKTIYKHKNRIREKLDPLRDLLD